MNIALFAVYILFFGGLLYLVFVLPQRRRLRTQQQMTSSLQEGEEVVTVGGVFGTVRKVGADAVELEVASGVTIKVALRAIGQKVPSSALETHPEDEQQEN